MKSKFLIVLSVYLSFLFEKNTSYDFELGLTTGSVHCTHLDLPLEWTVLPVIIFVFVVSRHLQFLLCIFMN